MNNRIIGTSTASGHEFLSLEKRFELFEQAGFRSIMLWWGDDEKETRKNRVALAGKYNLKVENVHADMANSNTLWMHGSRGDEKLNDLITAIDECKNYGVNIMVMHLTNGATPPKISDIGLRRLELLFGYAVKNNTVLAIENVRRDEHVRYVLDNHKDEHIAFCFDSGHSHIWCKSVDWLSLYGDRLAAIHLHDNNGLEDSHEIPLTGTIQWKSVMDCLGKSQYQGSLTLEAEYSGGEDVDALARFLKKTYQSGLRLLNLLPNAR